MPIVNLDKLQASAVGNIESVVHTVDMTNGLFFNLGGLKAGETELREVSAVSESTIESDEVLLHATPEVVYSSEKDDIVDFVVKAGKAGRAYHLTVGDIVTLTSDLFTATPTVGEFAVPAYDGSMKLAPSTDGTILASDATTVLNPRLVLKVIAQTTLGPNGDTAYVVQVVKA